MTLSGAPLRVLLYGKDARTDALAARCEQSSYPTDLFAFTECPIPGLLDKCEYVHEGSLSKCDDMVNFAKEINPDLVIIGPEEPLEVRLVDELELAGIPCFGPHSEVARIETSKAWARTLLDKHGIPGNPRYRVFETQNGIDTYLTELGDFVVKPDGLTGGKGVRVYGEHLHSFAEAKEYVVECLAEHNRVLIEERLDGEEFSLQSITDGETVVHCPVVQDHKRSEEGDIGPNTGGMGSYSCADFSLPFLEPDDLLKAQEINEAVVAALWKETGRPYRGVLYGGFIATSEGVRLIEYNARFGDPESLNVLSILKTDFVELCKSVVEGCLSKVEVIFAPKATVCKYVVPTGYPSGTGIGDPIRVPDENLDLTGVYRYWAAAAQRGSEVYLTGSRAIAFVGVGNSLHEAEQLAENAASAVDGLVRHRKDIGTREAVARRIQHMNLIRNK